MIPIYFDKTETDFTSNGIGRLTDCISCKVTEERNGIYELELEYPITGQWYDEMMADGGIIGVIHDDNHDIQPFDIYMSTAPIDGIVTFFAHHISYRLNNIMLQPFTASDAASAIAGIVPNSVNANPFTFSTDKTTQAVFDLKKPASVRSILFGSEGSLLDTFGTAEFKFDKFNVQMLLHRGTDTGVTVRYGKNMTDLERTKDDSNTYNALAPFWSDGVNYVYPDSIIVQPTTPITPVKPISMDFSDKFEQQPTKAELETAARNFLDANEPWLISDNIKVNFIALWQTEEYADVASIQRVGLCDTVSVYYTDMGIVAEKKKVVRVVFDVLTERFEELELGTVSNAYVAITDGTNQTSNVPVDQALNGKVSKTGDTMTGTLTVNGGNIITNGVIAVDNPNYAVGDTPSANSYKNLNFRDKVGTVFGRLRGLITTAGTIATVLQATRTINGTTTSNELILGVNSSGQEIVSISAPSKWLNALGLGTSGVLPVTIGQGGTGATDVDGATQALHIYQRLNDSITSSQTLTITASATAVYLIFTSGNNANNLGMYSVWVNTASSTPIVKNISAASNVTLTTSTGKVMLKSTAALYVYILCLHPSTYSRLTLTKSTS